MTYKKWMLEQFNVTVIQKGKNKDRICFKTPVINYTLSRDDWECLKEKILKV